LKNSRSPCIFCRIIAKEEPASLLFEDEAIISFLDFAPVNVGHLLVVPKQHVYSLADLDKRTSLRLFETAIQLLRVLQDSEQDWEGMNLHLAEGEAASQEIPHVHLHLIPRQQGDAVQIHLPCPQLPSRKELDGVAARLRHGLSKP
jgi:diadenosine tetraphosphate (Ap4A) HIT family hydrolase